MAILTAIDGGWILDHQQYIDNIYALTQVCSSFGVHCNDESTSHDCCIAYQFKINPDLFAIYEEFRMESQFKKMIQHEALESINRVNILNILLFLIFDPEYSQNGDKPKRRQSKRRQTGIATNRNGDKP